ncbi:polyisoprenoid-binding protein YceI [Silvibacterium bohemicum]|uniref:Polyisoprenoid-binding protein YceI n=1 Tax=Silvibacterium bohemicum TaxID=1577686 RepID=A0A841JSD8_9BACT|nr:YceI family protein [Silvibacterium bohemicum]MBB6144323.1 polyisoprenoid-binding protein YceI [Silvibacterium bohemicum]
MRFAAMHIEVRVEMSCSETEGIRQLHGKPESVRTDQPQLSETKGRLMTTAIANPTSTVVWKIDPAHSQADFKIRHMMISNVRGSFSGLDGTLTENTSDPTLSQIDASIDIATVNTGDPKRDEHLRSSDFFDVQKYPTMTFKSTKVEKKGEGEYSITGDLTLHGVSRSVVFVVDGPSAPGKDPYGNIRIGLSASTKINRNDFGLSFNAVLESGGVLLGEEVQVDLDVQFIKS